MIMAKGREVHRLKRITCIPQKIMQYRWLISTIAVGFKKNLGPHGLPIVKDQLDKERGAMKIHREVWWFAKTAQYKLVAELEREPKNFDITTSPSRLLPSWCASSSTNLQHPYKPFVQEVPYSPAPCDRAAATESNRCFFSVGGSDFPFSVIS